MGPTKTKLFFYRGIKSFFVKRQLHRIVEPLSGPLLDLLYLSKISKWVQEHRSVKFNDFPSPGWEYSKRYGLYEYVIGKEDLQKPIAFLEFGVAAGESFQWWVSHIHNKKSKFYGFDTFTGLPENWGGFKAGAMTTGSRVPPLKDKRATFIKGLFQDTLPRFLSTHKIRARKVIHLDADLYSSTLYVLTTLAPYLRPGDVLFFDEFTVPRHEFLAFTEFVNSYYLQFELLGAANNYFVVAFKLKQ